VNEQTPVWVASAWFSDSDPFLSAAYLQEKWPGAKAERHFTGLIRAYVRDYWRGADTGETLTALLDDVGWSGLHPEALGKAVGIMDPEIAGVASPPYWTYLSTF
jgi:hypothetical protein